MPAIQKIEIVHVSLPTRREHKWTGLTEPIGYILLKMTGDDGTVGWGEAPALKDWGGDYGRYFGESPGTTKTVVETYLAPSAIGCEVGNIVDLHQRMDVIIKGYPYAKAAMDIAAYDLAGRTFGVPVWQLLGGKVRDRIPVTHSIGLLDIEQAVEECRQVVDEGIRTIKIKVGVDPVRDVEIVRRIREAVGEATDLCVDANCGYPTPRDAIRIIRAMEEYRLKYAEQPVEGIDRMAEVTRAIATPVMADEPGVRAMCWRFSSARPRISCRSTRPSRVVCMAQWKSRRRRGPRASSATSMALWKPGWAILPTSILPPRRCR